MNLELKHILPYLPYWLKCNIIGEQYKNGNPILFNLFGANQDWAEVEDLTKFNKNVHLVDQHYIYNCIPLLRPLATLELTDFKKKIGSEWCEAYGEWYDSFEGNETTKKGLILKAPYPVIRYCLENHIDIYDLLDNDLALPIQD